MDSGCFDHASYDQLHELRKQRGLGREDSEAALKTRLALTHDQNPSRALVVGDKMDVSATGAGKRGRSLAGVAGHLHGPTFAPDKRY